MPFNVSRIVHVAPVETSSMPNINSFNIVEYNNYRARICNSMHGLSSKQAEKLCVCLSVSLSVCHTDDLPGTASFDSSGADHKALIICLHHTYFRLLSKVSWRCRENLSNIPLNTTADSVQMVEHLTHKQKVADSIQLLALFSSWIYTFWARIFAINSWDCCYSASKLLMEAGQKQN